MTELILAVIAFIVTHAVPSAPGLRGHLVGLLGRRVYIVLYSALSLGMIWWLVAAYIRAPFVEVWEFAIWQRWVPVSVMPIACVLFVGALVSPNPLSVSVAKAVYDPARPGIVAITRHPLMWAFALWSAAHLVPNGDLASIILFGLLLVLSLAGPLSLDAKARRRLGADEWNSRAAATSNIPFAAVFAGRAWIDLTGTGGRAVFGGTLLYAALLAVHEWAIGVAPWPV